MENAARFDVFDFEAAAGMPVAVLDRLEAEIVEAVTVGRRTHSEEVYRARIHGLIAQIRALAPEGRAALRARFTVEA